MEQCILGEQFIIRRKIGAGSFGEIYSGENIKTHRRVAIKLEKKDCKIPQLYYESKLYTILQGGPGIASIYWYGNDEDHNALVIDLLGKSLETLFKQCHSRFSLKTVLMLADQMISCIEYFHQKNYIHRDIKPDNFVMGLGPKSNQVFLIDFGLAKRYRDTWSHQHIQFSSGNSLTGTARYSSLNALKGEEQSRRDDLEALGYVLLYFLRGDLPWMGKHTQDQEFKYQMITYMKEKTTFEDLCCGYPDELVQYFYLVRNLGFAEQPNYATYKKIFRDLFIKNGFVYDDQYDWVVSNNLNTPAAQPQNTNTTNTNTNTNANVINTNTNTNTNNNTTTTTTNTNTTKNNTNTNTTNNSNIVIKQETLPKHIPKEQQNSPKNEVHKKPERTISSPKSENIIVGIKEKTIRPAKSSFTSSTVDTKKLIENPYFKFQIL